MTKREAGAKPAHEEGLEGRDHWRILQSVEEAKRVAGWLEKRHSNFEKNFHHVGHYLDCPSFVGRTWESKEAWEKALAARHEKPQTMFDECREALAGISFPRPEGIQRRPRIREDGERLDLQRHRDGDPNRYWQTKKVKRPGGHQTVVVAQCASIVCTGDSWKVTWRGAAATALCELLTKAGYQVEYWQFFRTTGTFRKRGYNSEQAIKLKGASERPDWTKLANLTSCWNYRTLGFSLKATDLIPNGGANSGLGAPNYNWSDLKVIGDKIARGRPVICIDGEPFSKEKATKAVIDGVEKFKASF